MIGWVLSATTIGMLAGLGGGLLARCGLFALSVWITFFFLTSFLWLGLWVAITEALLTFDLLPPASAAAENGYPALVNFASASLSWVIVWGAAHVFMGHRKELRPQKFWPLRIASALTCLAVLAPWLGQDGTWPPSSQVLLSWVAVLGTALPSTIRASTVRPEL